ncbi:MAG: hypothetical protein KKH33_06050 [Alphaproteobacteria bacterium]|nr:hypothetical protein [Alphaproteobacteria bacterium]
MSLRLKALLVVFQVSFLMWTIIIYAGYSLTVGENPQVDYIATASTE